MIEIGRGIGTHFETMTIVDGMTVKELSEQLKSLPPDAKIGICLEQIVPENKIRIPIEVSRGNLDLSRL